MIKGEKMQRLGKKIKTTNSGIFTYLVLFVFTTSEILQAVPILNGIINIIRCFVFIAFLWNYVVGEKCIYVNLVLLWQLAYVVSSCLNRNLTISIFFYVINSVAVTLFVMENIRDDFYAFIRRTRNWIFILLVLNLIHLLFGTPYKAVTGDVYILGLRVNFTLYCYVAIVFAFAYDCFVRKIQGISRFSVIIISLALITLFIPMVATGLIGLIAIALAYIILKREKSYWILAVIAIVAMYGVIFQADFVQAFDSFLELFGKDLTFSSRTYIWKRAIELIPLKPIWGYGTSDMSATVFGDINHPAHNEVLHVLYRGGAISFFFISWLFVLTVKESVGKGRWAKISMAFLFGIVITMITEILSIQNMYQLILALFYFSNKKVKQEKTGVLDGE